MNPIILYGSEKDENIANMLLAALRSLRVGVLRLTAQSVTLLPPCVPDVSYLLLDDGQMRSVQMDHCILLFKANCSGLGGVTLPRAHAAVLEPENEEAAALLQAQHVPIVTCGLSQKNTVTFSSRTPATAVVSLQREIHATDGAPVEPRELPVTLSSPRDDYPLLASVAALWLAGISFPDKGLNV
ncbi:hypothetical protein [Ethanoligenens harbinense]|uniref:Uncharacterized protein n=1 Tax=Ethanoligenens harbinense (strain DSM 18485 / JCM 12961 / CGMCC 1.5033 / YUAN-3) TaxID=663278 RepID=E6U576_ETHHY|nr:hypothetical protein [Ethanoligenens harbinense]ADU27889.1 hypothetical protein Ethha_2390 [Ethanoligenens harbinense YUAN-3]AVQ96918.1 hypothetical protein CXQ68_12295 [Ethanoligenens harbinense YUAN-3]AYF39579.1 hypothetical protein CXP51_12190 [Ethanoligenens harbinense]AYF42405.1 hypothetical protein CN246_12740 [Ethanoligenens harbinense]QCN93158.1 hypothetical protein DRA42_12330 [Ethanoligenens harbinense]